MAMTVERKRKGQDKHFGVVVSRFNDFITKRLLQGCLDEFQKHGVSENRLTVVWVPGAFELPLAALRLARKKSIDAVVCLGAVIRGETIHFDLVSQGAAQGIMQASLLSQKPVIFGVVTTDTVNQAYDRAKENGDNKGRDAAQSAIAMVSVLSSI